MNRLFSTVIISENTYITFATGQAVFQVLTHTGIHLLSTAVPQEEAVVTVLQVRKPRLLINQLLVPQQTHSQ